MFYLIYLITIVFIFILDQYTKYLVVDKFVLSESKVIIDKFFNLTYVRNFGAGFSLFENQRLFLILIAIIAIILISYLIIKEKNKLNKISYLFILGGTLGNLFDRIRLGYVVDFLDFYIFSYDFPIFNVADCFITVGCFLLIFDMLWSKNA